MPQRFHRSSNQIGKVIHEVRGSEFAVGVGQRRIPGNVDEAKSRLDGCAVVQVSPMIMPDDCRESGAPGAPG